MSGTRAFAEPAAGASRLGDPAGVHQAGVHQAGVQQGGASGSAPPQVASHDVVLLDPPELLERALRAALSPWGMRIASVVRDPPTPTLPGAALHAGVLARELGAKALVWVSRHADGRALWIYEASEATITARPIPDTPLDRALAAALALSVKTWLRSSGERARELALVERPEAADPGVEVPIAPAAPVVRGGAARPAIETSEGVAPSREPARWQVAIHAAARSGAFEPTGVEPRFGVEVRASPWPSAGATRALLAARVELGAAQDVANSNFQGVHSELGGGASLGVAHRVVEPLRVAFHIGATFHRGSVWGTLLSDRSAAERAEWGVAAQIRPEAELSLGSIGIILQPTVGVSILGERYEADEQVLLETRLVWWMLGGAVRADLF